MTGLSITPEDREVLRRRAQARIARAEEWNATANPPLVKRMSDRVQIDAGDLLALLDALTRSETQDEIRRLATTHWRERAEGFAARIKAVQDVLDEPDAMIGTRLHVSVDRIRRALDGDR